MRGDFVYNRYIPQPDGTYLRMDVQPQQTTAAPQPEPQPAAPCAQPLPPAPCARPEGGFLSRLLPRGADTGDLLVIAILLLLLVDSDADDPLPVILTLAAFILL